jgi:hypothetical protein
MNLSVQLSLATVDSDGMVASLIQMNAGNVGRGVTLKTDSPNEVLERLALQGGQINRAYISTRDYWLSQYHDAR